MTRGRKEETFRPRETRLPSSAFESTRGANRARITSTVSDSVNMNISPQDLAILREKEERKKFLGATCFSINYATCVCRCTSSINKANCPQTRSDVIFRLKESNRYRKCDNLFSKTLNISSEKIRNKLSRIDYLIMLK